MRKKRLREFQDILKAKERELTVALRNHGSIDIQKTPDPLDQLQNLEGVAVEIHTLDNNFTILREVDEALKRIQDGVFGTCPICDQGISPRRLKAVPWALLCTDCQEEADRANPALANRGGNLGFCTSSFAAY